MPQFKEFIPLLRNLKMPQTLSSLLQKNLQAIFSSQPHFYTTKLQTLVSPIELPTFQFWIRL